ncbi:MAG: SWIM zinc finger family protein, partial [Segetibacter sp.]
MKLTTSKIEKSLITFLKEYSAADVKKGLRLYQQKDANIIEFHEKLARYEVEVPIESDEDLLYYVTIAIAELAIEAECECPAFEDKGTCKHIAAAAIEILWMEGDMEMDEIENLITSSNGKGAGSVNSGAETAKVISLSYGGTE